MPYLSDAGLSRIFVAEATSLIHDKHSSTDLQMKVPDVEGDHVGNLLTVSSEGSSRPISTSTYSDMSSQYDPEVIDEKLAEFPSPPGSRAHTPMTSLAGLESMMTSPLTMSTIKSEQVEPFQPEPRILPQIPKQVAPSTPKLAPVSLVLSTIQTLETEPVEARSPRRNGVMIPRPESGNDEDSVINNEDPETPKPTFLGSVFSWNKKPSETPIIAEDETRQSPSDTPLEQTPESQRPLKERSGNTDERIVRELQVETTDESSQTTLTAEQIDGMLKAKRQEAIIAEDSHKTAWSPARAVAVPNSPIARRSQESIGSVSRARAKMVDPDYINDVVPLPRPGSASSVQKLSISTNHPPLPTDHKQVIAAAAQRSGSSNGGPGSMGPPPLPSTFKSNPSFRPRTPSNQTPISPIRSGTTPRALHSSSGRVEIQSPIGTGRSRASSVTSFASEVDTRFNLRNGMMPHGLEAGTDPRMINAITQTMIGEYLWKYTRKAGRGAMSENRHRRYFWVHPYTRTLYWSDRDPSQADRAELKAKSVPIEAVRVVTDDNPMPPGLHRKSLIIMTPGRVVKFTATTGQRHETWFNALSYLLLRTGEEATGDTAEVASGALTRDDVDEFNPGFRRSASSRRAPASLSSYNSRTTRNESPAGNKRATMPPHLSRSTSSRPTGSTFSRLSNYWKPSETFSSRRSRHSVGGAAYIYEASEVHDSAEDLREVIEKQDRESDKLENVRACCDGMFLFQGQFSIANTSQENTTSDTSITTPLKAAMHRLP